MGETTDHSTKLATLNSVTIKVREASIFELKYTIKKRERPEIWKILIAYSGIFFKKTERQIKATKSMIFLPVFSYY